MSDDRKYEVGRGKPPKHSQFKPGQSGNPKGRKKRGLPHARTILLNHLNKRRRMKLDGKEVTLSQFEIMLVQQCNQAMKGDRKSLDWIRAELGDDWERFVAEHNVREIEVTLVLEDEPPRRPCLHGQLEILRSAYSCYQKMGLEPPLPDFEAKLREVLGEAQKCKNCGAPFDCLI